METQSTTAARLQALADTATAAGIPGVSLAVQSGDQIWTITSGVEKLNGSAVAANTLFPIASSGKPYTGALVLRLAEQGLLNLGDSIANYLTAEISNEIPMVESISLKMLLAHTSGLPDYLSQDDYLVDFATSHDRVWEEIEVLEYLLGEELLFQPGSEYSYSNTNYLLPGLIVEQATGISLAQALRQWVFEPASLLHSYHPLETPGQTELAHGYLDASDFDFWPGNADVDTYDWVRHHSFADAPINATASDSNLFIRTLVDTNLLLTESSKLQMFTPAHTDSDYGLGIFITRDDDGDPAYHHTGGHWGYLSVMTYIPAKDVSYVVLVNTTQQQNAYSNFVSSLNQVIEQITRKS